VLPENDLEDKLRGARVIRSFYGEFHMHSKRAHRPVIRQEDRDEWMSAAKKMAKGLGEKTSLKREGDTLSSEAKRMKTD
jgi:hypothetical protein